MRAAVQQVAVRSRLCFTHKVYHRTGSMQWVGAVHGDDAHTAPHFHAAPCTPNEAAAWGAVLSRHHNSYTSDAHEEASVASGLGVKALGPGLYEADEWGAVLSSKTTGDLPPSRVVPLKAAVVVGSQSLMAVVEQGGREVARICEDTTLGHGLQPGQALPLDGISNAVSAISRLGLLLRDLSESSSITALTAASRIRVVGTAALRECADASPISAAIMQHLGVCLEVISGQEEGALSFLGATDGLPHGSTAVVIDLGSRSCELAVGTVGVQQAAGILSVSIPLGCKRCLEVQGEDASQSLQHRVAAVLSAHSNEIQKVQRRMRERSGILTAAKLSPYRQHPSAAGELQTDDALVVLTGGTATTLQALRLRVPEYTRAAVHHSRLSPAELHMFSKQLAAVDAPRWLTAQRSSTLHAGATALCELLAALCQPLDRRCLISDADLLDGVLASL